MSSYAKEIDLKNTTGVDISSFDNLKSDADKLDIDKLKSVRSDWSSLKNKIDQLDIDN